MIEFIQQLIDEYDYKKLPAALSKEVRKKYLNNLPFGLKLKGDLTVKIFSKSDTHIAIGYNRIVIGDYGAFLEFDSEQAIKDNIIVQEGQEYRINDLKYKENIKYFWLTAKDESGIKIYYQQKKVNYADYKPYMYYVSPYEIYLKIIK